MSTLLQELLAAQQDGTAVERFARQHAKGDLPHNDRYRALIPLEAPRFGQQYAFEVDLDSCTGCKACVTGCHNLNGLDDGEVWRNVGMLTGGTAHLPVLKTVTTACHHCLEPACMSGCPVEAYEKDPLTGIVKHLDDQCIGCQYCVLMCPYDVPKFNAALGIVRKCDMCSDRLAHQEAPACVQSCPNEAIRITVVDETQVIEAAQASAFLPGAPSPEHTLPTTIYRSKKELPRNLLPADFYAVSPEKPHPPLVLMLVLTQLSVGAFCVELERGSFAASSAAVALILGMVALATSVLHLGRPLYAFRALLGLRTSWLSREIFAFSVFAGLAGLYAASLWLPAAAALRLPLLRAVAGAGVGAVLCSVMVYEATRRPTWRAHATGFKFLLTTAVLGLATVLMLHPGRDVARALQIAVLIKLAGDGLVFRHLKSRRHTAMKRSALLQAGDFERLTTFRFLAGVVGGLALPLIPSPYVGVPIFLLVLGGELAERYLFFVTASAARMPGVAT